MKGMVALYDAALNSAKTGVDVTRMDSIFDLVHLDTVEGRNINEVANFPRGFGVKCCQK